MSSTAPGGERALAAWARERLALHALEYPVPARANRLDFMLGAHESLRYMITRSSLVTLLRDVKRLERLRVARARLRPPRGRVLAPGVPAAARGPLVERGAPARTALRARIHRHRAADRPGSGRGAGRRACRRPPRRAVPARLHALESARGANVWTARFRASARTRQPPRRTLVVDPPLGSERRWRGTRAVRTHLRPLGGVALLVVSAVGVLALASPATLLAPGVDGFEVTKPFWPFLWIYAAENLFGLPGMLLAPAVLFGFLALVPVADRHDGRLATVVRVAGVVLLVLMIVAIVYAALAPAQSHLNMEM